MAIPQSFIQELLSRVDVVDIVGKYVQLKKGGANFMGLCPFHGEKSPSFSVSPTKQFFHCFGCGKNGNAIGFLMEHAGMTFIEAVKDLAQQTGMVVPEEQQSPEDRAKAAAQKAKQDSLSDVLEKAGEAYRDQLKITPHAIDYLKGRGLSGQIAKRFGLGYAPEGWRSLASIFPKYDDPLLAESGLVIVNEEDDKRYDRFRDRIMFPIRNIKGECIGFGGRVIGRGTPKYLNSPETPVFHKGRELYGLYEAREALHSAGYVLVTEGYMDVVALAQLGFANAVATLGTACTAEHVQKLFRFTDSVVFSFDGDSAGRRAARKALEAALPFASDVRSVKFLFLPAEHDPDSYIREHGTEGFAAMVKQAVPLSRFMLEAASEACDMQTAEGRAHMASNARVLWSLLPDGALKRQLLAEIADQVQIDSRELLQLWQPAAGFAGKARAKRSMPEHVDDTGQDPASYGFVPAGGPAPVPWAERQGRYTPESNTRGRRLTGRVLPASREDRVLRALLTEPQAWDKFSPEEHALLSSLPEPHGPLFVWLESQLHEHGPQPWAALREGLREHSHENYAVNQLAQIPEGIESDWNEVRHILEQLSRAARDAEMQALALRAQNDPTAMARYRELSALQKPR